MSESKKPLKPWGPQMLRAAVEAALYGARMENASFGMFGREELKNHKKQGTDAYIKERTRIYRRSSIMTPLKLALAYLEGDENAGSQLLLWHSRGWFKKDSKWAEKRKNRTMLEGI